MIPSLQKRLDGRFQVGYAEEDAAPDSLVVQVAKTIFRRDSANWNDSVAKSGEGRELAELSRFLRGDAE